MSLYEKRNKMPPPLAEIPYGFKNLWIISVSTYNLATRSFFTSNILSITLNGGTVSAAQMKQLYDFNRDGCSLSQPGSSGLYITLTGYDDDEALYNFQVLIEQNLEITGVLGISGDMMDNSDPQRPVVGHDIQKLNVTQYETDQTALEDRLAADEANIQANAGSIIALQQSTIMNIAVNGNAVPVSDGTAQITIDAASSSDLAGALNTKVDKTVAGPDNNIVQNLTDDFNTTTRTLSLTKKLISLEDGSTQSISSNYALADLLGITALEAIDKGLFYFCPDSVITSFNSNTNITLGSLYRQKPDGTIFNPSTTANIQLIFAVSSDYIGYGTVRRTYISAVGRVMSATPTTLSCLFTNLSQYAIYSRYNSYRAGQIVCDTTAPTMYLVLQNVQLPTNEANTIALSNALYYAPVKDDTIMQSGTIWANLEPDEGIGRDYPLSRIRLSLLESGAGYNDYVGFRSNTIPAQILTDADWNNNIALWVTDGIQFTSRSALLNYLDSFKQADRFKISNNGIIITHYENGGITITPVFSKDTLQTAFTGVYQPVPTAFNTGNLAAYDSSGILTDSGKSLSNLATSTQGTKADSAVQSVSLASGAANGTVRINVDGNSQTASVTGLGSAAYTDADTYATSEQGEKADTAIQSVSLSGGVANGTVQLTIDGVGQSEVAVTGLNSAAYSSTSEFATAAQGTKADSAVQTVLINPGTSPGTIQYSVNGGSSSTVPVEGLGSAAFTETSDYATSVQGLRAGSALQPSDVVDNLNSTNAAVPLSANQGRILNQGLQSLNANGRPIGGFATYSAVYASTYQYPAALQPIAVNDAIYIDADENYMNLHTLYRVSGISESGGITYSFVRILPDALRDFFTSPIQPGEIAPGVINTEHIQNGAVTEADIADEAVSLYKLSPSIQSSIGKANNALQSNLTATGTGSVVTSLTQNPDKTLSATYGNAVKSVETIALGDFVTGAVLNGSNLELIKDGFALKTVNISGEGNVIVGASATDTAITLTKGNALSSITTSGSGNVITNISSSGVATKGTALASINKSGSGNVITDVSTTAGAVTLVSGNAYANIETSSTGNMVSDITGSGDTITITKTTAITSLPDASTSQKGVVQLNNTLTSSSTSQALTAAQGKALADQIADNDALYVKLAGNQTISGTKTLANDLSVPSKSALPATPSAAVYATEAQVATRVARPNAATVNNVAVFDANRNVVDSGVPYHDLVPVTRKINGKDLTGDITLSPSDIGIEEVSGATTSHPGIVQLATEAEAVAGTATDKAMSPATTKIAIQKELAARPSGDGLLPDIFTLNWPAEMHRMIFRGMQRGGSDGRILASEIEAIRSGEFIATVGGETADLFTGDYWLIDGATWRIWDMNYWLGCGDTAFTKPHLVIVPDKGLYKTIMNQTNTTVGGYPGSYMRTTGLNQAKTIANNAFPGLVLTKRVMYETAITNGKPSAVAWFDSSVDLLNEISLYGCYVFRPANDGTTDPWRHTVNRTQFALAGLVPRFITLREEYWLCDPMSATQFAFASIAGHISRDIATINAAVRPCFAIG